MTIGFIGNGNMGRAIISGIIDNKVADAREIIVSDIDKEGLEWINSKYGVVTATDNKIIAKAADILFLCVKPQFLYGVIDEIKENVQKDVVIVSIAAGYGYTIGLKEDGSVLVVGYSDQNQQAGMSKWEEIAVYEEWDRRRERNTDKLVE